MITAAMMKHRPLTLDTDKDVQDLDDGAMERKNGDRFQSTGDQETVLTALNESLPGGPETPDQADITDPLPPENDRAEPDSTNLDSSVPAPVNPGNGRIEKDDAASIEENLAQGKWQSSQASGSDAIDAPNDLQSDRSELSGGVADVEPRVAPQQKGDRGEIDVSDIKATARHDSDRLEATGDTSFVDRIRTFNRFISQNMGLLQEGYSQSDMSLTEARILYELAEGERSNARDLCKRLDLDPGYVSRILTKFEQGGLILREKAADDRRRSVLVLTERGRDHYHALESVTRHEILGQIGDVQGLQREKAEAAMATLESLFSGDRGFPGPVFVRALQPGDLGWVVQSHGALYAAEYRFDLTFEALVAEIVAEFARTHDPDCERAWIAESNGERVGSVFLVRESDDVARLRLLLIDPQARGIGLGGQLVRNCIEFARQAGYRTLTLWTQQNLEAARAIYRRCGFVCIKTEDNRAFGQDLISETWELDLTSAG